MFLPFQDLTLWQLITRLAAALVVIAVHGFALAGIASALGDRTAQASGRLTVSPFPHVSVPGIALMILFKFGWMMPVPVAASQMRFGRAGLVICYAGSLAASLAFVALLTPLRSITVIHMSPTGSQAALVLIDTIQDLGVRFVAFNMLPLPMLTGQLLLMAAGSAAIVSSFENRAALIQFGLGGIILIGAAAFVVDPIVRLLDTLVGA